MKTRYQEKVSNDSNDIFFGIDTLAVNFAALWKYGKVQLFADVNILGPRFKNFHFKNSETCAITMQHRKEIRTINN